MLEIQKKISTTLKSIEGSLNFSHRDNKTLKIIAVSKKKPIEMISQALEAGILNFGENYLQESIEKVKFFKGSKIIWHFIGSIQSNKCKDIAENFDWVHTVDRMKTAKLLSKFCPNGKRLNILIQINIDSEETKSGVSENELIDIAMEIDNLPNLNLKGIMVIPENKEDKNDLSESFKKTFLLSNKLQMKIKTADEISMGMSGDYNLAIENGSTMVRIGTGIFGERN
tara:strand:- start:3951 stop:4631 length:681 start_codon:yes stop_codon:yes gene_type:complete